jgi:curved DNA-binding protein CbpA
MPDFDPYKTLQVDPAADPEIIQVAYRRLALKYHPDVAVDPATAERMSTINAAWELLRDPGRRAAYDRTRADTQRPDPVRHRPPQDSPPRPAAGGGEPSASNWTSGRSSVGGGYDPATMGRPDAEGSAGPPPGSPSGSVMNFGRYNGWSLGEIARRDIEYIEWLDRMPIGRSYRDELDALLRRAGRRRAGDESGDRRGLFRRR